MSDTETTSHDASGANNLAEKTYKLLLNLSQRVKNLEVTKVQGVPAVDSRDHELLPAQM